jgi:hypothetical protein
VDFDKHTKLVNDPKRTREDLQQMMRNAIAKNNNEFAAIAKDTLDLRFPGWDRVSFKQGGAKPTLVRFRESEQEFPSSKEAYTWLVSRMIEACPGLFTNINWETEFVSKGIRRLYFSKDLMKMFHGSPHLADNPNNFNLLPNGWYANMDLDNDRKFNVLCKMAAVAKLKFEKDWYWHVLP